MIDWLRFLLQACFPIGLAVIMAVYSWASDVSEGYAGPGRRLRPCSPPVWERMLRPPAGMVLVAGLLLTGASRILSLRPLWERLAWGALTVLLVGIVLCRIQSMYQGGPGTRHDGQGWPEW